MAGKQIICCSVLKILLAGASEKEENSYLLHSLLFQQLLSTCQVLVNDL